MFGFFKKKNKYHFSLSDIKSDDYITIKWNKIKGDIGDFQCVNNDPISKTMLLKVKWNNFKEVGCKEEQRYLLDYKHEAFENFHVLNQHRFEKSKPEDEKDTQERIKSLTSQLNTAISEERYLDATDIQKKLDDISDS